MKKIMIHAYTYFNLGDDLFIKILCERYPHAEFILSAPQGYKHTFKTLTNIQHIPSDTLFNRGVNFIFKYLNFPFLTKRLIANRADLSVQIGGSLFIQGDNWRREFKATSRLKGKRKPYFLLGANFGPYEDADFYKEHKQLFRHYTDICFRDQYSYQLFSDLNNVRMADDIVFTLEKQEELKKENRITISIIKPSIRSHLKDFDDIYYLKISEIVMQFTEKGYDVTLMSFCNIEKDDHAIEAIMQLLPHPCRQNVHAYYYQTSLDEALDVIARSQFIVATRFHAMILAWVYQIPVFPIIYSEKMTHVINDIGFQGATVTIKDIDTLEANKVYESLHTNTLDITEQRNNADQHFLHLDALLNK